MECILNENGLYLSPKFTMLKMIGPKSANTDANAIYRTVNPTELFNDSEKF